MKSIRLTRRLSGAGSHTTLWDLPASESTWEANLFVLRRTENRVSLADMEILHHELCSILSVPSGNDPTRWS